MDKLQLALTEVDPNEKLRLLEDFRDHVKDDAEQLATLFPMTYTLIFEKPPEIRQWVVNFLISVVRRSGETHPDLLKLAADTLLPLLNDTAMIVVKSVIQASGNLYPIVFKRMCTHPAEQDTWNSVHELKTKVISLLESKNDGVKINVIKFMHTVLTVQSVDSREKKSNTSPEVSLDLCPSSHPFLDRKLLEEEGLSHLNTFISLLFSPSMSSGSITAIINCLSLLMRFRPEFIPRVVPAFESWHRTPTGNFRSIQKRFVERSIRNQLLGLMRSKPPSSYQKQITDALLAIGAKREVAHYQARMAKLQQAAHDPRQASKRAHSSEKPGASKKPRPASSSGSSSRPADQARAKPDGHTIPQDVLDKLDVTQLPLDPLVDAIITTLQSMSQSSFDQALVRMRRVENLADLAQESKGSFNDSSSGAPAPKDPRVQARDTEPAEGQSRDPRVRKDAPSSSETLSRDPRLQGRPQDPRMKAAHSQNNLAHMDRDDSDAVNPYQTAGFEDEVGDVPIKSEVGLDTSDSMEVEAQVKTEEREPSLSENIQVDERVENMVNDRPLESKPFELGAPVVYDNDQYQTMAKDALIRILQTESTLIGPGGSHLATTRRTGEDSFTDWMSIVARLVARGVPVVDNSSQEEDHKHLENYKDQLREILCNFVAENFRARHELAALWLQEEWYNDVLMGKEFSWEPQYPKWLHRLLDVCIPTVDAKDRILTKFFLDIPEVTEHAASMVKMCCDDSQKLLMGLSLLRDLANLRPPIRDVCLDILLSYCIHKERSTRSPAIVTVKKWVPDHVNITAKIEAFALESLQSLSDMSLDTNNEDAEPAEIDPVSTEPSEGGAKNQQRDEQDIVRHLELFFALCTKKPDFLKELFVVYTKTSENVRKVIRQEIYPLIKSIGMNSTKLLNILRNFHEGGETLVLRILVILTDKAKPSPQLVNTVKSIYTQRELDARFLIPIMPGLEKEEAFRFLPNIICLLNNTESERKVVKEVMSKLISTSGDGEGAGSGRSQISPSELLVALHNMEDTIGLKRAVEATQICFSLPEIFTSEVLAVVLQQLVDQPKIPTLFMRTVMQSVSLHKNLAGFINSLLSRLITKKIWNSPKLWDGFIRCCKLTQPASFTVLIQLPKNQLQDVLLKCDSLKEPLKKYILELNAGKRNRLHNLFPILGIELPTK
ncbi:hypothetical protein K493DRAFT_310239 [Basidiobolus meristosporus CBS 931.73]|uniref:Symplekin n=1 Tax=Basidiobolus meristosporus CBS 931.73 TaxID=1314790 RepID=A0A1Y1ZC00_9FUNG|nr:hypothetical protein K493DRAFT_310239 [Basidiobolus meristosporus CBS 931.73]|eukprot:ORY07315.1 hypothetical protein K493DRAFT_310239 [Basidiobolus meristosporus CBS 931.73]